MLGVAALHGRCMMFTSLNVLFPEPQKFLGNRRDLEPS